MPAFRVQLLRPPLLGALLVGAVACGGTDSRRESAAGASGEGGRDSDGHTAGAPAAGSPGLGGAAAGAGNVVGTCREQDPEPNDFSRDAVFQGNRSDCDDEGATAVGTLAGDDVDWWRINGLDSATCLVNPTATSSDIVRLCLSATCHEPGGTMACEEGFGDDRECCSTVNGVVSISLDCPGLRDDADVWLSVEQDPTIPISGRDCLDYSVDWHF